MSNKKALILGPGRESYPASENFLKANGYDVKIIPYEIVSSSTELEADLVIIHCNRRGGISHILERVKSDRKYFAQCGCSDSFDKEAREAGFSLSGDLTEIINKIS
ncbi:MAG: hypothetical protein WC548_02090 [Candidatus Pacearchaeota archaeon]